MGVKNIPCRMHMTMPVMSILRAVPGFLFFTTSQETNPPTKPINTGSIHHAQLTLGGPAGEAAPTGVPARFSGSCSADS
jgi:hypothetical protein